MRKKAKPRMLRQKAFGACQSFVTPIRRLLRHHLIQIDAKAATISAKHYGSRDAMLDAAKKRNDIRDVVMSKLAHEVMPK